MNIRINSKPLKAFYEEIETFDKNFSLDITIKKLNFDNEIVEITTLSGDAFNSLAVLTIFESAINNRLNLTLTYYGSLAVIKVREDVI